MRLPRLPIAVAPARHETLVSYLTRLASLHGLHMHELWEPISFQRPGSRRRDVVPDRLAAVTGHDRERLARALPELHPTPAWTSWRHQPQLGCPRCDARHRGGTVTRLLPHHRYVCLRHRYWIGPPDVDQPATALDNDLADIVRAQRRHQRLLHRYGTAAAFDAVLTGFLFCGHLWTEPAENGTDVRWDWARRADALIPRGSEAATFSASLLFAVVYPEAVRLAGMVASPAWRRLARGNADEQRRFISEVGRRLGRLHYQPPANGDAIAHWMVIDSPRSPSRPDKTFPETRQHGASRGPMISKQSLDRHDRSALWFGRTRNGGGAILHHRHIRPVLIREWSREMDGIAATIWASRTTHGHRPG